ncbi:hypothetical protein EDI_091670 [Entamoeba dispar SAW760]|uniref:Uncharacterized protein n=1 Tax=Entamoeba dispar (strain ATCC PRA-260 / SAW760) TaxID=370354 RepID=B0ECZ9_ENTDS|nr:uncharacterized protein EDI_091670 [Entamoeba dispar SAW760]EDR27416.1 hypothetical protein EDI_091670 [Entamoeba dispar SAW760]|eukprot:EDR27416.1 hypothetical protein EDI_091670 [Entamoeba dispar SAW760]
MTKLEPFYLSSVLLYVKGMTTVRRLKEVSKNTAMAFEMLHINPQNISSGINWLFKTFPNINTIQGPCDYVLREIKKECLYKISWIDSSLSITHANKIKPEIEEKFVK